MMKVKVQLQINQNDQEATIMSIFKVKPYQRKKGNQIVGKSF
jgi:hypothetical protein